jgi:glycosyltransferase involved in cell wall biosynthesis
VVPCVVIPTFWTRRRVRIADRLLNVYDHPTSLETEGTLPALLASLERLRDVCKIVVIVAATDPTIEHEAEDRVHEILSEHPSLDSLVFGTAELGSLHRRFEQLEFADLIPGVSLTGYGAVRNLGLIVAGVLGCEAVVFIDDDEVVTDPEFLRRALEGIGERSPDGASILAKTGYYVDRDGRYQMHDDPHWADMFWRQSEDFNEALAIVDAPPRLRRSTVAFGGCMALHREIFTNVSFDPWVVRGEDMDYVINARMHGADVFLDGEWKIVHEPPVPPSPAIALRQDVYRFIYEHRKLEFAKSQVDLRQVTPDSLKPYPGEFIGGSITWRATLTALLHMLTFSETGTYFKVARAALSDASKYARENCDNYFAFQRRWPLMMERIWEDVALNPLFTGERRVDRSAITGRFPVIRTEK